MNRYYLIAALAILSTGIIGFLLVTENGSKKIAVPITPAPSAVSTKSIEEITPEMLTKAEQDKIRDQAVGSDSIVFTNCQPSDKVVKIVPGNSLTITNNDAEDMVFYAGVGLEFTLKQGEIITIPTNVQKGVPKGFSQFDCIRNQKVISSGSILVE